ncbi:YraN family protein [Tabrizicola sp.]|jgi:putative endonuclease|uniref:YraN family protein n=1 Tax=Tabrizicola sp. TaxID=2005166 RepID=UPI001A370D7D|nr:YraN family protein [Tabrizicola sp.]MBL9073919.1 YraN family protein [Tabrizicola sp.]
MPFDFVSTPARRTRKARGLQNHLAGHAAEASVARLYEDLGIAICARNWRGITGEIDLVGRRGDEVIFVEVKQSRTHDMAASHISQAQIRRIFATVDEFLAGEPKGLLTDVRIDLALVDGRGRIEVLENAFAG